MKKITPSEYAVAKGITLQAVTKMIRDKGVLPGVKKIEKYGRFYLLELIKEKNKRVDSKGFQAVSKK